MIIRAALLLELLIASLLAEYRLQPVYIYDDATIYSTTLFPSMQSRFKVMYIPDDQHKAKIPASKLIDRFAKHKMTVSAGRSRYVTFVKKSPADLSPLKAQIAKQYQEHYPSLQIKRVTLVPRAYTHALPKAYTLSLRSKDLRHSHSTFYIRPENGQRLYFDYYIDGKIDVIHTKTTLERKEELTAFNTSTKRVPFDGLRQEPLTDLEAHRYRLKHKIKADRPIGIRDVERSPMVKRSEVISVSMHSDGLFIEFPAVALEDGALHDIIAIRKHDGQRLKAKVTGLNSVEIE